MRAWPFLIGLVVVAWLAVKTPGEVEAINCRKHPTALRCRPTPTPTITPTPTPVPIPTPTPTPAPNACLGAPLYAEKRPSNITANQLAGHLTTINPADSWQVAYLSRVDGACTGTTEQILEWLARKWFPERSDLLELLKAQAMVESWWYQSTQGDWDGARYQSYGIMQVKLPVWCGGYDNDCAMQAKSSTAFNGDFAASVVRAHYDGFFLGWTDYCWGDIWCAVASWYSGQGYGGGGDAYAQRVKGYLDTRAWTDPSF